MNDERFSKGMEMISRGIRILSGMVCENCRFRSDEFTSACGNGESERCADFVDRYDTCEWFESNSETMTQVIRKKE